MALEKRTTKTIVYKKGCIPSISVFFCPRFLRLDYYSYTHMINIYTANLLYIGVSTEFGEKTKAKNYLLMNE